MADKVRIEMTEHGRGRVFVNDVELQSVYQVRVKVAVDKINLVILTLNPSEVTFEGPAVVWKG